MKNSFDERYIIRLADRKDISTIMNFIGEFWKKDHILSKDKILFEYEFVDNDEVNFVVAIDKITNQLEGIFGFLKCSQNIYGKDIWGSFWKVIENHNNIPFLGIELAKRVHELTGCRMHIGSGANPNTTIPLRKIFFGDKTSKMVHYYMLNDNISDYKIAVIEKKIIIIQDRNKKRKREDSIKIIRALNIIDIEHYFDISILEDIPYKDYWYIEKRFFKHPYYKYNVYILNDEKSKKKALMMTREVEANGGKALRIVDYMGERCLIQYMKNDFQIWMNESNYEYIDFYNFGFEENYLENAGFKKNLSEDLTIIPNYFEPFLQENVDIWVHYKYEGTLFFKADCDQDRPNQYITKHF